MCKHAYKKLSVLLVSMGFEQNEWGATELSCALHRLFKIAHVLHCVSSLEEEKHAIMF